MSNIESAFESLGRPQSSAQAFIDSIEPTIVPRIIGNSVQLARRVGDELEPVLHARTQHDLQIQTADGEIYKHYDESSFESPHHVVLIGEVATWADDAQLGASFARPRPGEQEIPVMDGMVHLFTGSDGARDILYGLQGDTYVSDVSDLSEDEQRRVLVAKTYGLLPTRFSAGLAAALVVAHTPDDKDAGETFNKYNSLLQQDKALEAAASLADTMPEFSERAVLTRYLRHQLDKDAVLHGNEIALEEIDKALDAGVEPISFDEMHDMVRDSVMRAIDARDTKQGRYL